MAVLPAAVAQGPECAADEGGGCWRQERGLRRGGHLAGVNLQSIIAVGNSIVLNDVKIVQHTGLTSCITTPVPAYSVARARVRAEM